MSYYTYCVVRLDLDEPWEVFPGIDERPVFAVREQKMAVLVSRLERPHLEDARSVVQHGQVIHRVFERRTVLPFRYGTVFTSQEQVEVLLRENRDQFTEAIRFLRGKAEMHVKLLVRRTAERPLAMAAAAGSKARSALDGVASNVLVAAALQEVNGQLSRGPALDVAVGATAPEPDGGGEAQARLLAQRLSEVLRPLQEQVSVRLSREGQVLMDLRHLIEEDRLQTYQRMSALAAERMKDCQIHVTGPWPPYHFLPVAVKLPARSEVMARRADRVLLRARGVR